MNKGIRFIISVICTILAMIAEKGTPVKLTNSDKVIYAIQFGILLVISGYFKE